MMTRCTSYNLGSTLDNGVGEVRIPAPSAAPVSLSLGCSSLVSFLPPPHPKARTQCLYGGGPASYIVLFYKEFFFRMVRNECQIDAA